MTVKDQLHELIDRLEDDDVGEVLEYARWRLAPESRPSQAFVEETRRALDEALAPGAVRIPHDAVRVWLESWGTPRESAAEQELESLEDRLRHDALDSSDR